MINLIVGVVNSSRGNAADNYPDEQCRSSLNLTRHDPPLLYDLWLDPGEMNPLVPQENYNLLLQMLQVPPIDIYYIYRPARIKCDY